MPQARWLPLLDTINDARPLAMGASAALFLSSAIIGNRPLVEFNAVLTGAWLLLFLAPLCPAAERDPAAVPSLKLYDWWGRPRDPGVQSLLPNTQQKNKL